MRIKQFFRVKPFLGTSENAVKSQIWIAVSVYGLVAIIRSRPGLGHEPPHNPADPERGAI